MPIILAQAAQQASAPLSSHDSQTSMSEEDKVHPFSATASTTDTTALILRAAPKTATPRLYPPPPLGPPTSSSSSLPHPLLDASPSPTQAESDSEDDDSPTVPVKASSAIVPVPSQRASHVIDPVATTVESLSRVSTLLVSVASFLRLFFTFQVVLDPGSPFKRVWDYLIIVMILYNAFIIPYYIAFDVQLSQVLLPLDIICTLSMALDILVTLRTGFIDFSGNTCYDSWAIARRYWTRGLILDLIGTFPMDIFSALVISYGQRYANLLKAPGLLRASRLAYNDRLAAFNSPTARIIQLMFGFFYMAHLFGAAFFFVGSVETSSVTWITKFGYSDATLTEQYIVSLYWALTTMVTVGYGDIVPTTVWEQAVVIPILMLSALIYATIFGNMAYAIETITSTIRRYQSRMDMVKEFIKVYELPLDLQRKLFDYTNAMWNQNKGFETEAMLAHLPTSVKAEVMLHINESLIHRVPLLKQCSDRFLEAIILRMTSQVCLGGDYIFKEGDKSREMYFIRTGSVEIIMEDEQGVEEVIATIHSYSDCPFFGEISLLLGETRTASAKATTKCVLSGLSQEDFFEVLSMFPDEENSLRETASARLQNDIDREQAALAKKSKRDDDDDDDADGDDDEPGKTVKKPSSSPPTQAQKSKHENRLTALEMTTLGNAQRDRTNGTVTGPSLPTPSSPKDGMRRGSASKALPKGTVRMHRLQGGLPMSSSRLDESDSPRTDAEAADPTLITPLRRLPSQASRASGEPAGASDGDDSAASATSDDELEERIDHQKQLRTQLGSESGLERRLKSRQSSQAIPDGLGGQLAGEELQMIRVKRDIGELREKERMMEKAALEMEDRMRAAEASMVDMRERIDQLTAALAVQGQPLPPTGSTTPSAGKGRGFTFRTAAMTASPASGTTGGTLSPGGKAEGGGGGLLVRSSSKRRTGVRGSGETGPGAIAVKPSPTAGGAVVTAAALAPTHPPPAPSTHSRSHDTHTSTELSIKTDEG